jgi:hypothetical protein
MNQSNYYRTPRSTSKCGKSASGQACVLGPLNGKCGQVDAGSDQACKPVRTLHWWNRTVRVGFTLSMLILVGLAWSKLPSNRILVPGPLSSAHAQLLVSKSEGGHSSMAIDFNNRCSACHVGMEADSTFSHSISGDFGASKFASSRKQSELCLACHLEKMPNAAWGSPHDLTEGALAELVERGKLTEPRSLINKLVSHQPIGWQSNSTECGQCHREHQGAMHTLSEISSQRCQACHQKSFESFSHGHPEFKDYPYRTNRKIVFDHQRHQDLHFSKNASSFDCKSCHVQDGQVGAVGQVFRSLPFETACASCHSEATKSAVQDGVVVLQLPSVNRRQLVGFGVDIGPWPEQSSQMNDGTIPAAMRWLIEAEPGGPELLASLPESGRISEVDMNQLEQREALVKLLQVTKKLMQRLANDGQPGFRESAKRLISTSANAKPWTSNGEQYQDDWLDHFSSGLPPDLFRAAVQEWFPSTSSDPKLTDNNGREKNKNELAKVWLSSRVQSSDDDLLVDTKAKSLPDDDLLSSGSDGLLTDESLLKSSANDPQDLLLGNSLEKPKVAGAGSSFRDSKAWDQLSYGGWMIDRLRMAIVYVPKGHADPWLSRWVELEQLKGPRNVSASVAQQCRTCHQLGSGMEVPILASSATASRNVAEKAIPVAFQKTPAHAAEKESLNPLEKAIFAPDAACWRADRRTASLKPISKFDHTPHLTISSISDCRSCHALAGSNAGAVAPREFQPIQKAQCSSCHQPNAAGEACTQCHNYHVGNASWR